MDFSKDFVPDRVVFSARLGPYTLRERIGDANLIPYLDQTQINTGTLYCADLGRETIHP